MSKAFPALAQLARRPQLEQVARALAGMDGRRIRKTVSEAMLGRLETVIQPGDLTIEDLMSAVGRIQPSDQLAQTMSGGRNGTN
jgi:hypothetical protein